jgi:hypothetical protein
MNELHPYEKGHSWMNFSHDDGSDIGHDIGNGIDDDVGNDVSELLWDVICDNNYIQC